MADLAMKFHLSMDAHAYEHALVPGVKIVQTVTRYRSLTYRFFPHYHPYVPPLIQRLNEGGLASLQNADTTYLPQPGNGQPLTVMPGSTRARLAAATTAMRGGASIALSAGTPVTLRDGTNIAIGAGTPVASPDGIPSTLAAAATVALPGRLPVASASGIQWSIAGAETVLPDQTQVGVPAATTVTLVNDGSQATLPAGTRLYIRRGLPRPLYHAGIFDTTHYDPDPTFVSQPYPVANIDFSYDGAYSLYNWELFFHVPLLMAIHLSQNKKFREAQIWFHYIFRPDDNGPGPTPDRFWKVAPFQNTDVRQIEEILTNLSTNQDPALFAQTVASIDAWKQNPFQPFVIGKYRPSALMMKTVMAYLDNLFDWGDSLFEQYTIETINEASQLYIMAANILGPKPQAVPKKGATRPLTYNDLRGKLNAFSEALVDMEVDIPFDTAPLPNPGTPPPGSQILAGIGQTLYFCVPRNDILLGYWDKVADRLFKIHNSLNLRGIFQRPPLFDPPIDPAMLVRAAAAGLDVSAVVSGLNQPLPLMRFTALAAKATEICQLTIALSARLEAAMEKRDAESLAAMRVKHESDLNTLNKMVKYGQLHEAKKAREALQTTLANTVQRYRYFETLLGRDAKEIEGKLPKLDDLDIAGLKAMNLLATEPEMAVTAVDPDISTDSTAVSDGDIKTLSTRETAELDKMSAARIAQIAASALESVGSGLAMIPQFKVHGQPMGVGATVDFGGQHLHAMMQGLASISRIVAEQMTYEGSKAGKLAGYARRELDWVFQSNNSVGEINMTLKQLRGAQIREALAQKEYDNHLAQMKQLQDVTDFLDGKTVIGYQPKESTANFYALMKRQVKALQQRGFQIAFDLARKAERALQAELGDPSLSFVQFNYLDGGDSLLAGEKLLLDVKTMEVAQQDLDQIEHEMTKQVSLLQIAPAALVELRATGSCTFTLPEELFDMDAAGDYFRRSARRRPIAITVPCVAGPYTSVNCTLTLEKSAIRINPAVGDGYARSGTDDPRFSDYYGTAQQIITSRAQADAGVFDDDPHDRLKPFERIGIADSRWRLSLPSGIRQFPYETIADIVLDIWYTSRPGGAELEAAANANLHHRVEQANTVGSVQLFSVRHDFPTDWARFQAAAIAAATPTAELALTLRQEHYPFWSNGIVGSGKLKAVELYVQYPTNIASPGVKLYDKADMATLRIDSLDSNPLLGDMLTGKLTKIALPAAVTDATHPPLKLYFDDNRMKDMWIALTWGK